MHVPTAGQQQQYLLTSDGLLEVNRVRHAASSWLVDNAFVSGEEHNPDARESVSFGHLAVELTPCSLPADGSAYLATPINPVFVLLGLLNITPEQV